MNLCRGNFQVQKLSVGHKYPLNLVFMIYFCKHANSEVNIYHLELGKDFCVLWQENIGAVGVFNFYPFLFYKSFFLLSSAGSRFSKNNVFAY